MIHHQTSAGSGTIDDPRSRKEFDPQYYPTANGRAAAPVGAEERNDRITLEFLAVYYDLNFKYAKLLAARAEPMSPPRTLSERELLQSIEQTLVARDRLEDLYAPCGVIAEPTVEDGFTVDVIFAFGNVDARGHSRSEPMRFAAHLSIPLPSEGLMEELSALSRPGCDKTPSD